MDPVRVVVVDHSAEPVARAIHAVQRSAYAQEARVLGVQEFPPLRRTLEDVRTCAEEFLAVYVGSELVGSASVEPDHESAGVIIASLTVAPAFQRRGLATALLEELLRRHGEDVITVQTGAANLPALELYARSGFVESRRWRAGEEALELVELRRRPPGLPGEP